MRKMVLHTLTVSIAAVGLARDRNSAPTVDADSPWL